MKSKGWMLGILLMLLIPFVSGCWDRLELEDRAVILGLAIDPVEEGGVQNFTGPYATSQLPGYKITAQVAIPGRIPLGPGEGTSSSGSQKPVWVLSATGKTFADAMALLQKDLADKISLGHLRVIIINKTLAKNKGMRDIMDYLRRNSEIRRLAWMVVSEAQAEEAMAAAPKLERVPTLYLVGTMDHAVQLGKIPNEFLGKYWSDESSLGQEGVLPFILVKDHERVELSGLALFKDYKLVGTLGSGETAAYMELTNQTKGGFLMAVPLKEGSVSLRATNRHTRIKFRKVNGMPVFDTYSRIELNIEENTSRAPLENRVPELEREANALISSAQQQLLMRLKSLQTDSIGFGEYIRGGYSQFWQQNVHSSQDWGRIFATVPIHCSVKTYIRRAGVKAN